MNTTLPAVTYNTCTMCIEVSSKELWAYCTDEEAIVYCFTLGDNWRLPSEEEMKFLGPTVFYTAERFWNYDSSLGLMGGVFSKGTYNRIHREVHKLHTSFRMWVVPIRMRAEGEPCTLPAVVYDTRNR